MMDEDDLRHRVQSSRERHAPTLVFAARCWTGVCTTRVKDKSRGGGGGQGRESKSRKGSREEEDTTKR